MNHAHELRRIFAATPWAMRAEDLRSMTATLSLLSGGGAMAEHALEGLKAARAVEAARRQRIAESAKGAVAVLPLYGCISQRSSWMSYFFGGTTVEDFTQSFREAMTSDAVTAIILDIDSPGGSVAGIDELAAEIYAARGKKKIVALSDTLCASAAYYLGSQASEFVVMPSSLTGSIGVYQEHDDLSGYLEKIGVNSTFISAGKYKVEGNSLGPLTDEARAAMQAMVDGYYRLFVKAVAKGRGVKMDAVMNGFGEGRVLMAPEAVASGMADRIGTLDSILAGFGVARPVNGSRAELAGESVLAAIATAPVPEAATEAAAPAAGGTDDSDVGDDEGDENDDHLDACGCGCAPCSANNCPACTADDCDDAGCQCDAAKRKRGEDPDAAKAAAAAEHARLLALQRQRFAFALNAAAEK